MSHEDPPSRDAATARDRLAATDEAHRAAGQPVLSGLPLVLPPARRAPNRNEMVGLAAAIAIHGGLLVAVVHGTGHAIVGGGGSELDAINIDVIAASEVLEAVASDRKERTAPEAADSEVARAPSMPEPAGVEPRKALREEAALTTPQEADEPVQAEPAVEEHEDRRKQDKGVGTAASLPATPARGTSAVALDAPALAAAPPGIEREYARIVLFALARNKPKVAGGDRGTVKIGFTVTASGKVGSARVAKSSGKARLDEAALAAVRSTEFPLPPPQLGNVVLAYEIPYIFR